MKSLILKDIYNILHNMRSMAVLLLFFIIFMIPQGGTAAYQAVSYTHLQEARCLSSLPLS